MRKTIWREQKQVASEAKIQIQYNTKDKELYFSKGSLRMFVNCEAAERFNSLKKQNKHQHQCTVELSKVATDTTNNNALEHSQGETIDSK